MQNQVYDIDDAWNNFLEDGNINNTVEEKQEHHGYYRHYLKLYKFNCYIDVGKSGAISKLV